MPAPPVCTLLIRTTLHTFHTPHAPHYPPPQPSSSSRSNSHMTAPSPPFDNDGACAVTSWAQPPSHLQQYRSPLASASMAASALDRFSEDSLITLQDLGTLTAHIMGTPAPAHGWAGGERVLDGPTAAMVLQVRRDGIGERVNR